MIYCPSIRPIFAEKLRQAVHPVPVAVIDGSNAASFASLVNSIVATAAADGVEEIVIANDKARPSAADFWRLRDLLSRGFGFVGLFRMGFFGLHRGILGTVGALDERFCDGGYEDNDYYIRLKQHDVAVHITEDIPYERNHHSLWPQLESAQFFKQKYTIDHRRKIIAKHLADAVPVAAQSIPAYCSHLRWRDSVLGPLPLVTYAAHFERVLRRYKIVQTYV